jgi:hypothetical protein
MRQLSAAFFPRVLLLGLALLASRVSSAATNQPPTVQIGGTIKTWGSRYSVPANLNNVVAIAAGGEHTVALKSDGSVVTWGGNVEGQTTVPADLSGVAAIAAGGYHTVALKSDGTVVAWGRNVEGQTSVPAGLSGVVAIAAGGFFTVALKSDGTVVAWGHNNYGETSVPAGLSGVVAIAADGFHTVALKSDGTVVAWGRNVEGQTSVPAGLSGVVAITTGGYHAVALKSDGTVVAWGYNIYGQTSVPAGLSGVVAIAAGGLHTVALKSDGTVDAWGYNGYGQIYIPASQNGIVAIAAGPYHTITLHANVNINENGAPASIPLAGITAGFGETTQNLIVTATSSDPSIIPNPTVSTSLHYTAPGGLPVYSGSLLLTPQPNAYGTVAITVTVKDDGGVAGGGVDTTTRVFLVNVLPVNDAPTFIKGSNITVPETSVAFSQTNWASNMNVGPANESAQTFQFLLSNDHPGEFLAQPAIDTHGTLTFTPAQNINTDTVVTVTATLRDSGGVANGGVDSVTQTFTITLTPVSNTLTVANTSDAASGSLRDCLTRARNTDTVAFDPDVFDLSNSDAATVINVLSELPPLKTGITLDASDRRVTLNGSGAPSAHGLVITSNGNIVRGLTIVGFSNTGVCIKGGAKNNVLGGSRLAGTGPNGQGLRIGNNGSAGVYIAGSGADNNTVKGCWIGLTASGESPLPNLAGVLIDGGAQHNVIGGTSSGERNVVSGNYYEGVTVSGAGTDENIIAGNIIGASGNAAGDDTLAPDNRRAVPNGSSGVFLSKGTRATRVGGETVADGNLIAFNGGNGIEVRAAASKHNSVLANIITANTRGGIRLYDGSNENVATPVFTSATLQTISAGARSIRSSIAVQGTVTGDGVVELYSDSGQQGGTYLGRATASGGLWSATVDAPPGENITATFTDASGNTSSFAVYGLTPSLDSDGDGVPDALEEAAGTDPNNPSDAPQMGSSIAVDLFSLKLDFAKSASDSLKTSLRVALPEGYLNDGAEITLSIGGWQSEAVTLDAKGASPKGAAAVKLTGAPKSAVSNGLTLAKLGLNIKNGDLQAGLAEYDFTARDTGRKGESLTVPISVVIRSQGVVMVYSSNCAVTYKATEKMGAAKKTAR